MILPIHFHLTGNLNEKKNNNAIKIHKFMKEDNQIYEEKDYLKYNLLLLCN